MLTMACPVMGSSYRIHALGAERQSVFGGCPSRRNPDRSNRHPGSIRRCRGLRPSRCGQPSSRCSRSRRPSRPPAGLGPGLRPWTARPTGSDRATRSADRRHRSRRRSRCPPNHRRPRRRWDAPLGLRFPWMALGPHPCTPGPHRAGPGGPRRPASRPGDGAEHRVGAFTVTPRLRVQPARSWGRRQTTDVGKSRASAARSSADTGAVAPGREPVAQLTGEPGISGGPSGVPGDGRLGSWEAGGEGSAVLTSEVAASRQSGNVLPSSRYTDIAALSALRLARRGRTR